MNEKKVNQKSIRMTNEVLEYVEKQGGKGFNQKFENIVLKFKNQEPLLNKRIAEKEKQLSELQAQFEELKNIYNQGYILKREIEQCINTFRSLGNKSKVSNLNTLKERKNNNENISFYDFKRRSR